MPRPRSYSFDYFKAPKTLPPERVTVATPPPVKGATHKAKKKVVPPSELKSLHYGMKHAETALLLQEHQRRGGHDPEEEQRVVKSLTAAGAPIARGTKTVARAGAAAKRKAAPASGKSSARKSSKKG